MSEQSQQSAEQLQRENALLRAALAQNNIPLPATVPSATTAPAAASTTTTAVSQDPFARSRTVAVTTTVTSPAAATPALNALYGSDAARELADSTATAIAATNGNTTSAAGGADAAWEETAVVDVPKDDWWVLVPRPGDAAPAATASFFSRAFSATAGDGSAAPRGPLTSQQILDDLAKHAPPAYNAAVDGNNITAVPSSLSPCSTAAGASGGGDVLAASGLDADSAYVVVDDRELRESLARFVLDTLTAIPEARGLSEEEVRGALNIALAQASHGDAQTGGGAARKVTIDLREALRNAGSHTGNGRGAGYRRESGATGAQRLAPRVRGVFSGTMSVWSALTKMWGWGAVTYQIYKNPVCNKYMLTWAYNTMSWALFLIL